MKQIFLAISALLALASAAFGQSEMELSARPYGVETYQGTALIGVDDAGRFLIALDATGDGLVDHCFLYTNKSRLEGGPWSELVTAATLRHAVAADWASLTLSDAQGSLYLRLALEGAPLERFDGPAARRIVHDGGWELVRVRPPAGAGGAPLASMDHGKPESWPASFWYDLLAPESAARCVQGNDEDCEAGGLGASQCSLTNSPGGPCTRDGACSVTCSSYPRSFACCGCARFDTGVIIPNVGSRVSCRCRICEQMSEARPRPGQPPANPR